MESYFPLDSEIGFLLKNYPISFCLGKDYRTITCKGLEVPENCTKTVRIDASLGHALVELFYLLVVTASPQEKSDYLDAVECIFYSKAARSMAKSVSPDDWPVSGALLSLCEAIYYYCAGRTKNLPKDIYNQVTDLTASYKRLLLTELTRYMPNYYNPASGGSMSLGSSTSYLDVYLHYSTPDMSVERASMVIHDLVTFLISNSDGPIQCYIDIVSDPKQLIGRNSSLSDLCVLDKDFNSSFMINLCRSILCKKGEKKYRESYSIRGVLESYTE